MEKNAIILAAGKSGSFAPFTYEKPKGLFNVKGEILIERQIRQLKEAGIKDIYVVVGYMKEKYFYLENKFGVKLIVNNKFGKYGNLYSLYVARDKICNTYICCADHYYMENPFTDVNADNISYRACSYFEGKFREFGVTCSDMDVITDMSVGGSDSWAMVGYAYMKKSFSVKFCEFMNQEINNFGVASMFWEEFYAKHIKDLTFYRKEYEQGKIVEFESIEDLRKFDSEFLLNVDSDIISNICSVLKCNPNDIVDINVINAGLTNVSFSFYANDIKYVYRHPGSTAGNLIERKSECFAQMKAKEYGLDKSVIYLDEMGWKISYYVEDARCCDFENDDEQLNTAMSYLHRLHDIDINNEVRIFDNVEEGKKLMRIASLTKGNLEREFGEEVEKIEQLYEYVKLDSRKMGKKLVLCHNDVYAPNYLIDKSGNIYLIDWEYAGLNYEANDIGCILCRHDWTNEQIERYIENYLGHVPSEDEKRYYYAFIAISGFYWFCWGLYKGSVGDDDGFFFLPAYHNMKKYLDESLKRYRKLG